MTTRAPAVLKTIEQQYIRCTDAMMFTTMAFWFFFVFFGQFHFPRFGSFAPERKGNAAWFVHNLYFVQIDKFKSEEFDFVLLQVCWWSRLHGECGKRLNEGDKHLSKSYFQFWKTSPNLTSNVSVLKISFLKKKRKVKCPGKRGDFHHRLVAKSRAPS